MEPPKESGMKTSQMLYKGSIIGAMVTIPSLVAFILTWHFSDDLLVSAIVGAIVHGIALVASFKVAKIISNKAPASGYLIHMNEHADIARVLVREIGLSDEQARLYVLVATNGAMNAASAAGKLGISDEAALACANRLVDLGGFIDYGEGRFESMHPRFSSVNMYRRSCQERDQTPGQNFAIDNVGSALERDYDHARTKYNKTGDSQ